MAILHMRMQAYVAMEKAYLAHEQVSQVQGMLINTVIDLEGTTDLKNRPARAHEGMHSHARHTLVGLA